MDFVCLRRQLVVEVDGPVHDKRLGADARRSAWLGSLGYQVLRFTADQVNENVEGVVEEIRLSLLSAGPLPTLP